MRNIILISAICLQLTAIYGAKREAKGVGAFAFQDSSGNRYGGTYGLRDGQPVNVQGDYPGQYVANSFYGSDDFVPDYFYNLENLLQETFNSNIQNQRLAYNAARKAFDLTSNHAGYIPYFTSRLPFNNLPGVGGFPGFPGAPSFPSFQPFDMPNFGDNSAFASAALRPGFSHQIASISPGNPNMPNINKVNRFGDSRKPGGNFYSVSSSSYASSSNVNGQQQTQRGAETVVNDNGKVVRYKVQN